jgi:hypothetical protein
VNAQQSPYRTTGLSPYDDAYADVTVGFNRAATILGRKVTLSIWGKEDFNPNASGRGNRMGPHGDSDFQLGVSFRPR